MLLPGRSAAKALGVDRLLHRAGVVDGDLERHPAEEAPVERELDPVAAHLEGPPVEQVADPAVLVGHPLARGRRVAASYAFGSLVAGTVAAGAGLALTGGW